MASISPAEKEHVMAHKAAALYRTVKLGDIWTFRTVDGEPVPLSEGSYYLNYNDGKRHMDPVGPDPKYALKMLEKKRLELAFVAAGGEVKKTEEPKRDPEPKPVNETKTVSQEVTTYLTYCLTRQGKSGYGIARGTTKAYTYRLGFLVEFRPNAYFDEIDGNFVAEFLAFLRSHESDLSDRTCFNILQAVSTFLLRNGIVVARSYLRDISFPPTEVNPYTDQDMAMFFAVCDAEEEITFKFFLHSMARDMEVAHCEKRDLNFERNVLHISPKPDRDFRLKGKRSGQAKKGRKVPVPALFMSRLKAYCVNKAPRQLLFPNGIGGIETHFLRRCKKIAQRAGLPNWDEFNLHRWRKTGATRHHEAGVSVRKIQAWLGHETLEVTLDYLGVADAADESSQEQVNTGALSAYV
jgi:integrase